MTQLDANLRYSLIGLSQKQSHVLADALELVGRLGMGQLEYLMEFVRYGGITSQKGEPLANGALLEGDKLVEQLKAVLTGYTLGGSKSIGSESTPTDAKIAFELYKAIRHRLSWVHTPEGGHGVHFTDPYLLKHTAEPKVALVPEGPAASSLDQLPPGCFVGERDGRWTVVQPTDSTWAVIAEARDAATAVANARIKLGLTDGI
ncbi:MULTISPECIES: hypothetical protein [unclassified Variovorax]|uniref:hypothetical protein n=1 Tax=unclassified Variovorax TaxID=663243 RepID=UPI001318EAB0|nr:MULTISPECIES: hypothetical protein [unclassified Variovorax]VTU42587.1 hypothetical protein H6P1_00228 [Variovorax sp. PBL-H6]VTU43826.1 hypothetical protein SRS16P1_00675 [Variovorax sp. SRS16]VTU43891.1 hypothetical protein E5P1_00668 [Variovorax sp. PBL-E5]